MTPVSIYLIAYNAVQATVWALVFTRIVLASVTLLSPNHHVQVEQLFNAIYPYVLTGQSLAWMEVAHAACGIAGASVATTAIQTVGRYVVLKWVIGAVRLSHGWVTTIVLFAAWSMSDVVRYIFYISSLLQLSPYPLRWCRYSLFAFLQPVGISAEWLIYWWTLSYVDSAQLYRVKLPNVWNFAFDFGTWNRIVLVLYFYFGPLLIRHMLKQRRSKLSP